MKIRDGADEWGWGVVVNVVKKPTSNPGIASAAVASAPASSYIVDVLLYCASGVIHVGKRPRPRPCPPGEKGEMHVVRSSSWCYKFGLSGPNGIYCLLPSLMVRVLLPLPITDIEYI